MVQDVKPVRPVQIPMVLLAAHKVQRREYVRRGGCWLRIQHNLGHAFFGYHNHWYVDIFRLVPPEEVGTDGAEDIGNSTEFQRRDRQTLYGARSLCL